MVSSRESSTGERTGRSTGDPGHCGESSVPMGPAGPSTTTPLQGRIGLVGAGGSHQWDVKAIASGQQEFSGIYMQPWMNATGNETTFTLMVNVT